MKQIALITFTLGFLFPAFATTTLEINDRREDVISIIDQFHSIGLSFKIPYQIPSSLGFNNGNNILSPGELAILSINHSTSHPFTCLAKIGKGETSKWGTQEGFARKNGLGSENCLNKNYSECLISFQDFQLKPNKDKIFIMASPNTPPGSAFKCITTDGNDIEFEVFD